MSSHPINLAVRFLLEICTLIATGAWGWQQTDTWFKFVLAIGIPILLAAIWGIFAVPNDPSRSGKTVIITPGKIRLILEICFFAFGTYTLYALQLLMVSIFFGVIVLVHYLVSYDRIKWLMKN